MSTEQSHGLIVGRWPGVVASYDKNSRECRVKVPGITDGGDTELLAEIEYPVGDKSKDGPKSTDILMMPGDLVWLSFIGGDPRYPVITGQRNPKTGNGVDWRRHHQANMELLADMLMNFLAGQDVRIEAKRNVQTEGKADVLTKAGSRFAVQCGSLQLISEGRVHIESKDSSIVLKSATGKQVI